MYYFQFLEKIQPIEGKLKYQIDKLIKQHKFGDSGKGFCQLLLFTYLYFCGSKLGREGECWSCLHFCLILF